MTQQLTNSDQLVDSDELGTTIRLDMPPSSQSEMDEAVQVLHANKDKWINLSVAEKIHILDEIMEDFNQVAEEWVDISCLAKGESANNFAHGEEWFYVTMINRLIRLLKASLEQIQEHRRPKIPGPIRHSPDGQVIMQVFPQTNFDRLLLRGTTAEIFIDPGITFEEAINNQAQAYKRGEKVGKTTLILGAGNTTFLVPGDFLNKLFVDGHVVAFKPNPNNVYLGPLIERGFQALIRRGFMRLVYGDVQEGAYLCHHPLVDEIHMTGSHRTYEAIVFGPGEQGQQRKRDRRPLLKKKFSAELGNITPVIVVPGDWSQAELRQQAVKIASWLIFNASYACPTPRLIIQSRSWPLRQELNQAILDVLSSVDTRPAYYPGSQEIHQKFISHHPEAIMIGDDQKGHLPWTYIIDVDAENPEEICFQKEAFCSLFAETALEGDTVPEFLERAVAFVNENVWGTLHAVIVIHPKTLKTYENSQAYEQTIEKLQYGTIAVNQYPALSYYIALTTWGGYSGQDIYDIQSGVGFTNNTLMIDRPQKSILRAPFKTFPDPFTIRNKRAHEFGRKMADFEVSPSVLKLPSVVWSVLRG